MSDESKNQNQSQDNKIEAHSASEIRYIPVEFQAVGNEDEKVNLYDILRTIWNGKRTIFGTILVFIFIGLFVALLSVEEYTSDVQLIPEDNRGFSLGAFSGLAQQFGLSSSITRETGDEISVNLYPSIIKTNVFISDLMDYKVLIPETGNQVTLEDYFKEYQQKSVANIALRYTIKLPITIRKWFSKREINSATSLDRSLANQEKINRLTRMSQEEWEILDNIRSQITTFQDTETGIFSVSVTMQDPVIAADIADEVVQLLSSFIIENRTEKARRELKFIEERFDEAKERFEEAQNALAAFNDQNRGQLTAMARTEEQLLQSRYNLNFNLYNSMAQRLEEARINLQEHTPVINILEPASVPSIRSAPKRTLIMIVFTLLGGLVGVFVVFGKPYVQKLKREIDK